MSIKTKRTYGYLLDRESKVTIAEGNIELTLIETGNLAIMRGRLMGVLILKGFLPEYNYKFFILKFNENIMGRVNLTLQSDSSPGLETRYNIIFGADSIWSFDTKWFESL